MILTIKSDTSDVEIRLFEAEREIASKKWNAGRELSVQLLGEINNICNSVAKNIEDIEGIIVYQGPGSYTGLRISISVANGLGYSYKIPVVGSSGDNWIDEGLSKVKIEDSFKAISPVYGGSVFTTKPRK